MSDRCPTCDRPTAGDTDWPTLDKPRATRGVCYETGCAACVAIGGWRARALAAEARAARFVDFSAADEEAITAQERARVVAWLRGRRQCVCVLEGFAIGRHDANCPKPIDECEDAADAIAAGEHTNEINGLAESKG